MKKFLILMLVLSSQLLAFTCNTCGIDSMICRRIRTRHFLVESHCKYKEIEADFSTIWRLHVSKIEGCDCYKPVPCRLELEVKLSSGPQELRLHAGDYRARLYTDHGFTISKHFDGFSTVMSALSWREHRQQTALIYRVFNHQSDKQIVPLMELLSGTAEHSWTKTYVERVASHINDAHVDDVAGWMLEKFEQNSETKSKWSVEAFKSGGPYPWKALLLKDNQGEICFVMATSEMGSVSAELLDLP